MTAPKIEKCGCTEAECYRAVLVELADACDWNASEGYPPRRETLRTCARAVREALASVQPEREARE